MAKGQERERCTSKTSYSTKVALNRTNLKLHTKWSFSTEKIEKNKASKYVGIREFLW